MKQKELSKLKREIAIYLKMRNCSISDIARAMNTSRQMIYYLLKNTFDKENKKRLDK